MSDACRERATLGGAYEHLATKADVECVEKTRAETAFDLVLAECDWQGILRRQPLCRSVIDRLLVRRGQPRPSQMISAKSFVLMPLAPRISAACVFPLAQHPPWSPDARTRLEFSRVREIRVHSALYSVKPAVHRFCHHDVFLCALCASVVNYRCQSAFLLHSHPNYIANRSAKPQLHRPTSAFRCHINSGSFTRCPLFSSV